MPRPAISRTARSLAVLAAGVTLVVALGAGCGSTHDSGAPVEAGGGSAATPSTGPVATPSTTGPAATVAPPAAIGPASVAGDSVGAGPSASGGWQAVGLVRNDGPSVVGGLHVHVTLTDGSGAVVGQGDDDSLVTAVRPGETVPFHIATAVPADRVASTAWLAFATAGPVATGARDLTAATYWTRPYGDGHRLDLPAYRDPAAGPTPFALYGSLANGGAGPVASPTLVLAWIGTDGRVVAVAAGAAVDAGGGPVASLAPGASADVLVLVGDPVAGPALTDLVPRTWTTAR